MNGLKVNVNSSYEFNPASENVLEQIVTIREYLAINRYGYKKRTPVQISGQAPEKAALPEAHRSHKNEPVSGSSFRETTSEPVHSRHSENSAEFFERFYIHDHMNIKNCQSKYKAGLSKQSLTSYESSYSANNDLDKADIYELNSHQVISLKGIRVNHSA